MSSRSATSPLLGGPTGSSVLPRWTTPEPIDQDLDREVLGGGARQSRDEDNDDHLIDSRRPGVFGALVDSGELPRRSDTTGVDTAHLGAQHHGDPVDRIAGQADEHRQQDSDEDAYGGPGVAPGVEGLDKGASDLW